MERVLGPIPSSMIRETKYDIFFRCVRSVNDISDKAVCKKTNELKTYTQSVALWWPSESL